MRRSPNVIPCLWPGFTFGFAVGWRASCFVGMLRGLRGGLAVSACLVGWRGDGCTVLWW
jgi:hypothetical protein